jgi:hypothetical protein
VLELVRGHVESVHVDGLRITIPPGDVDRQVMKRATSSRSKTVVDLLLAHDAVLTILRRKPGHNPLVFDVHALRMSDLSFDRPIPFHAELTNAMPHGEVVSDGSIGPWDTQPSDLPIEGQYTFSQANLDDIKGIGGMLSSTGSYQGTVSQIRVVGETTSPDFNLDLGGTPVPLSTKFTAIVDGSNGTTKLESVDAKLYQTPIHVAGDVVNLPGPAGFNVDLTTTIEHGHIEDLLTLAMKAEKPPFRGDVSLRATVHVPAGHGPVRDRLHITGKFGLTKTVFTDGDIERKLTELSRRGQGEDPDVAMSRVMTNLQGDFQLAGRQVDLSNFTFQVPGATVALDGTYSLADEGMAFEGQLRTKTSLSNFVGGVKSIFIKPFDWLFRRNGAGAVVPIRITGTREQPKFTVRAGAALTRGK